LRLYMENDRNSHQSPVTSKLLAPIVVAVWQWSTTIHH
jgi:hypothetical protein